MNPDPRTATYLFTDLEGSTPMWDSHRELMPALITRHDSILAETIEAHRGRVVKNTGDGFFAVFEAESDAAAAAMAGQQAMSDESWPSETGPLRVRMGLHTGESQPRGDDFFGRAVSRAARVMGLAHGQQILVSEATAVLIRSGLQPQVTLIDLGFHRLKGFSDEELLFQLQHPALPAEFPPLKSLSVYKHNLPLQLSAFVGRDKEIADVKRLLNESHLLTLVGTGGTGKTRLMLEAAEDMVGQYADGVWLVELAPLTDPSLVAERIAAVLNVQEQPGRAMIDTLVDYLRRKELLLLLDNAEHLVAECAQAAESLLTHCAELKIMVTSREAFFIPGEVTLQISSLTLPGSDAAAMDEIQASESVQLFLARSQEIKPDMALSPDNAPAMAEIVRRLDGIPLAIELAAARTRMLSVQQIAERLNDRFRLLTSGRRTALPRQQTLQALIDWSWNLLDEKEQALLRRLSVFSGGWVLEAAEKVASDEFQEDGLSLDQLDIFDGLEQLVNKSLVTVSYPDGGEARYGMLESIHQYGRDRLLESGETEILRSQHARFYVDFASEAASHLAGETMTLWTRRITLELDNLRHVMAWSLENDPVSALRICSSLFYREAYSLSPREARFWLEPAIDQTRDLLDDPESQAHRVDFLRAVLSLALAHGIQGLHEKAFALADEGIQLAKVNSEWRYAAYGVGVKHSIYMFNLSPDDLQELEEAVEICRENGYDQELGLILIVYGTALEAQGKREQAAARLQEAAVLSNRSGTRLDAGVFGIQARLASSLGDVDLARRIIEPVLEDYEAMGHRRGIVMGQSALAHMLRQEGNYEEAEPYYRETIVGWQELGHLPAVAHQIECLAYIAMSRGENEQAAVLLGAAGAARKQMNALSEDPQEIQELAEAMAKLAEAVGEDARDEAMARGSQLSLDEAVLMALEGES